jgi:hypothetical protein
VRVPEEAGSGKAKVVVSIAGWPERQILPATFEIPTED